MDFLDWVIDNYDFNGDYWNLRMEFSPEELDIMYEKYLEEGYGK